MKHFIMSIIAVFFTNAAVHAVTFQADNGLWATDTWYQADTYCTELGGRLPTLDEGLNAGTEVLGNAWYWSSVPGDLFNPYFKDTFEAWPLEAVMPVTACVIESSPAPVYLWVEKEGLYTVQFEYGWGEASIYVNGNLVGSFTEGLFEIGYLTTDDTIRITVDGFEAEIVDQLDWQSWNLFYNNQTVKLYVEDPPIAATPVEEEQPEEDTSVTDTVSDVTPAEIKELHIKENKVGTTVSVTFQIPGRLMKDSGAVKAFLGLYFEDGTVAMLGGDTVLTYSGRSGNLHN